MKTPRPKGLICGVADVNEGGSVKFSFRRNGEKLEGFLIRRKGKFFAYLNRCRHISLPLDFGDNDFFSEDKKLLVCKNHGALYLPETGECVGGPCAGQSLERVPLRVEKGLVFYDGEKGASGFRLEN